MSIGFSVDSGFAEAQQAGGNLQAANDMFNSAFNVVVSAEKAGANVSSLLVRLNEAADVLAQAEVAYRSGDADLANSMAARVHSLSSDLKSSAQAEESATLASNENTLALAATSSAVGCVVFVLVLFLVWRKLKSVYVNSLRDAKPEVVGNEA
ncbi:MAG: hypothetical protein ACE14S_05345 [Candidatus Bathyarchaeia archaeon]